MSYRYMNSLGFVGYQFGEALLIDLGYYEDDFYYGNGAPRNTWDGTWTGKNGVDSLEDFMTAAAQDQAIQVAFGYNLQVIETGLGNQGESLSDYLGTQRTFQSGGVETTVTLTLTGIMAAAHLRGAWGTLSLLQNGSVTTDEYGTSILRYVDQFGGFAAPTLESAIAVYSENLAPPTLPVAPPLEPPVAPPAAPPVAPPVAPPPPVTPPSSPPVASEGQGFANPAITAQNATVVIDWAWGRQETVSNFDPAQDTIFFSWLGAADLDVTDTPGGLRISVPSNNQSVTFEGVSLADLCPERMHLLDATARALLKALTDEDGQMAPVSEPNPAPTTEPQSTPDPQPTPTPEPTPNPAPRDGQSLGPGQDSVDIFWNWGVNTDVVGFDPLEDVIHFRSLPANALSVREVEGNLTIEVIGNGGNQTTFVGLRASDLTLDNVTADFWNSVASSGSPFLFELAVLGFELG